MNGLSPYDMREMTDIERKQTATICMIFAELLELGLIDINEKAYIKLKKEVKKQFNENMTEAEFVASIAASCIIKNSMQPDAL